MTSMMQSAAAVARRKANAGGPFSPLDLNPSLWLDASVSGSLYDATSGGSLVSADGAVARWEDQSGNGNHVTQASSGARPLRKAAIKNGLDVIRFDGSDDQLNRESFNAFGIAASSRWTVFAVLTGEGLVTQSGTTLSIGGIYSDWSASLGFNGGRVITSDDTFRAVSTAPFATSSEWQISWLQRDSNTNFNAGRDTQEDSLTTPDLSLRNLSAVAGIFLACDVSEILAFPSALSAGDLDLVRDYLNAKWAIY